MNNLRHLHVNSWLHCDTYVDISSMRMLAFCIDIDTLDIWWIANLFDANEILMIAFQNIFLPFLYA